MNENFYSLSSSQTFETIEPYSYDNGTVIPIAMVVTKLDSASSAKIYNFSETSIGPLDDSNAKLRTEIRHWKSFSLGWDVRTRFPDHVGVSSKCYRWRFHQRYDFTTRGLFTVTMHDYRESC